jgi:hypothetical protein
MNNLLPADLIANGVVPQTTLIMILMLPVIATILGISRHVIGFKSLGLYAPIVLTYAYFEIGLSSGQTKWASQFWYGVKVGLLLTFIVFITSYLAHTATKLVRLHYFPKIALVLTAVATSVYIMIILADQTDKNTFLTTGFLPIILIATVSEQFVGILAQKNLKTAASLALTTMLVSILTFSLVIYKGFQDLVIDHPYILLITVVLNIIVGKFTGLRIMEYFRFKDILDKE